MKNKVKGTYTHQKNKIKKVKGTYNEPTNRMYLRTHVTRNRRLVDSFFLWALWRQEPVLISIIDSSTQ